jgi:hypothetical protein
LRRADIALLAAVISVVILLTPAALGTAAPRDAEQENEAIVHRSVYTCGVEPWLVKTGMDQDARLVNTKKVVSTTIFHLRSLAPPSVLPLRSRVRPVETTVWSVDATLQRVKIEQDSDYHLVLSDSGGRTMIAEVPAPQCVGSQSPFLPTLRSVRRSFDAHYHVTDVWQRPSVHVQVTGVGSFDFLHGQSGVAPNGIELHPVLAIRFGGTPPASPPTHPTSVPASGSFTVSASVSPNPVPYGAYPTLSARTVPGAVCSASVLYSTGYPPRSFN